MDPEIAKMLINVLEDAIKILGPAAITGLVGFKVGQYQLKMKQKELESANSFKASEHIFNYFKEKEEKLEQAVANLTHELGQLSGIAEGASVYDTDLHDIPQTHVARYRRYLPIDIHFMLEDLNKFEGEFTFEKELIEQYRNEAEAMKSPEGRKEFHEMVAKLIEIYEFLARCSKALIEKEAREIFNPYLKKS